MTHTTHAIASPAGNPDTDPAPDSPDRVRWAAVGWDDPAAAELRTLMDAEIKPRYAAFGPRPHLPPPPTADEVAVTWIAFTGSGEPVATASLRALPGDRWEIKRVFVRAGHRGRGLAAVALAAVEASAAERGVAELMLQTGVRQPEAAALYAREGWYRIPPYPPYSRDPYSVCFAKRLPATGGAERGSHV
ncbi:GNAT family N-acetyltransferase [Streptomyces sp. 110]|uniref:GNAT family N-acetyltransferase n=1 Tax=Streptomyces endocoffeicus TaxID=2898945 RepID=A0ABS1PFU9_9ACTN|nr:GNAT family N-acetyltransferase [Streptomyces endocoffeicus]MBL1111218.1 GNAT family N-acetyltransferase [Streptomyces endocoffeicus]